MLKFTCLIKTLILACILCLVGNVLAQNGFSSPYSHYSDNEQLYSVLSDFARSQGYTPVVSNKIQGNLSGRFDQVDPNLFLDGLYSAFGVRYYIHDNAVYFYHDSESISTMFKPSSKNSNQLLNQLKQAKIITPNLPVTISPDGLILIKGPIQYVEHVIATAQQLDQNTDFKPIIKVFKLKHAKAEDIQVQNSERTVVIPGIASILQSMVSSSSGQRSKVSVTQNSAQVPSLMGSGLASTAKDKSSTNTNNGLSSIFTPTQATTSTESNSPQPSAIINSASQDVGSIYQPTIIADSRLNAVIIQDAQYRMSYYSQVINELDVPVRLIELHAAIVDVDVDSSRSLGVNWNGAFGSGNWGFGASSGQLDWDGSLPAPTQPGGIFSTVFETGHSSVMMQINALEQNNKARTLGKPSVLTMDNIEATLEDTTTRYIPVQGFQDTDLFKVESGTILRVTPHIVDSGDDSLPFIQMQITLQSNQDNSSTSLGSDIDASQMPPIKQTKLNTQAVVREGQSLLIGGYYVQYTKGMDNGIPTLKDTPVVGGLFGSDSENTSTRERLLIITPRILSLDEINVPKHADYNQFLRDPSSASYEQRPIIAPEEEERSGCSSTRNADPQPSNTGNNDPQQISAQVQSQTNGQNQNNSPNQNNAGGLSSDVTPGYQVIYTGSSSGTAVPQVVNK